MMNNENNFTKNFREVVNSQSSIIPTKEEQKTPVFNITRGNMPENYGYQQNLIGTGALTLLSMLLGGPLPITELAGLGHFATFNSKGKAYENKQIKGVPVKNNEEIKIIDTIDYPSAKDFPKIEKMPTLEEIENGKANLPGIQKMLQAIPRKRRNL